MPNEGVPDRIVITQGQPGLAVFSEFSTAYAISWDVYMRWSGRSIEHISSDDYERIKTLYPVAADLAAGRGIRAYQVPGPGNPGCLVVPYRDGMVFRHHIDSVEWLAAVGLSNLTGISAEELGRISRPGTVFRRFVAASVPGKQWCVTVFGIHNHPSPDGPREVVLRTETITAANRRDAESKADFVMSLYMNARSRTVAEGACTPTR